MCSVHGLLMEGDCCPSRQGCFAESWPLGVEKPSDARGSEMFSTWTAVLLELVI